MRILSGHRQVGTSPGPQKSVTKRLEEGGFRETG